MNTLSQAYKIVEWCRKYFSIPDGVEITCKLNIYDDMDCWGFCEEDECKYRIVVSTNQSLRDFVATIVHEMVHVMQWETDTWDGDGEAEASHLQYSVTDKLWSEGVL